MKHCPTDCRKRWIKYESHCYLAVNVKKTWREASEYCKGKGGDLTSISNQKEHDFIMSITDDLSTPYFWVGLFNDYFMGSGITPGCNDCHTNCSYPQLLIIMPSLCYDNDAKLSSFICQYKR